MTDGRPLHRSFIPLEHRLGLTLLTAFLTYAAYLRTTCSLGDLITMDNIDRGVVSEGKIDSLSHRKFLRLEPLMESGDRVLL